MNDYVCGYIYVYMNGCLCGCVAVSVLKQFWYALAEMSTQQSILCIFSNEMVSYAFITFIRLHAQRAHTHMRTPVGRGNCQAKRDCHMLSSMRIVEIGELIAVCYGVLNCKLMQWVCGIRDAKLLMCACVYVWVLVHTCAFIIVIREPIPIVARNELSSMKNRRKYLWAFVFAYSGRQKDRMWIKYIFYFK